MDPLEGSDLDLACPCGSENFERVVAQRRPASPIVTDFVACIGCRAVYFHPLLREALPTMPPGHGVGSCPYPQGVDSLEALKREAAEAAKDYRKPGRSGRIKSGGRR